MHCTSTLKIMAATKKTITSICFLLWVLPTCLGLAPLIPSAVSTRSNASYYTIRQSSPTIQRKQSSTRLYNGRDQFDITKRPTFDLFSFRSIDLMHY